MICIWKGRHDNNGLSDILYASTWSVSFFSLPEDIAHRYYMPKRRVGGMGLNAWCNTPKDEHSFRLMVSLFASC